MGDVLVKAAAFVAVILAGYLMKRGGLFKKEDFHVLSKVVIYITLPSAIISNFSKMTIDYSLLLMCLIGIFCNLVTVAAGYLVNIRKSGEHKAFDMLNMSGYNIGNFTMLFVQNFFGPVGFAVTSLFDAGNAVMCTGLTYTAASAAMARGQKTTIRTMARQLFSSLPFDAYMLMTVLSFLHISLPAVALSFTETVGGANAFVALFMTGIGFELKLDRENLAEIGKTLALRYGIAVIMSLAAFFLLPFSLEVRQALAVIAFGPVSSVAPAFSGRLGLDVGLASVINSLSIVVSLLMMTGLMLALGIATAPRFARVVRGPVLQLKNQEYIEAARAIDLNFFQIIFSHVLPNVLAPIIVQATLYVAGGITAAAGLSFVGLGAQPPSPEWGAMLSAGRAYIVDSWWIVTFPGIAILLTVFSLNVLGDGLRDALDPKLKN
mgnify:CR=1 FL=1